jgi:hypothetical protein
MADGHHTGVLRAVVVRLLQCWQGFAGVGVIVRRPALLCRLCWRPGMYASK